MKRIFVILISLMLTHHASAEIVSCTRDDASIAGGAASAASGSSQSIVKGWMPKEFWINEDTGDFGTSKHGRDALTLRTTYGGYTIYARTGQSRPSNVGYQIKLKKIERSASVTMTATGFKNMGPLRYDCSFSSTKGGNVNKAAVNAAANYFKQMSLCDRKYVQQFLKGQGAYNSTIDGLWGNGTASALSSVKKSGKLKGLSDVEILKKLQKNPVCD